jgi:hypothetical protein
MDYKYKVLIAIIILYIVYNDKKEHFASQRAEDLYQASDSYFKNTENPSYTNFSNKNKIDFVEYHDIKDLWKKGQLNPDSIDNIING